MELLYKAQTRFLFHAHIKIKIPVFYEDKIFDELFGVLETIDHKYNSYQSGSYIDIINKNAGSFVNVDETTIKLLKIITFWSDLFEGIYDITIMPLIRLWGFYKKENIRIPKKEEIKPILRQVNYKGIEIKEQEVRIQKGQEIITGSFIKAYAVDRLVKYMQDIGIQDAIINAGGSTIRAINNEIHPFWTVNVRNPNEKKMLFQLHLSNQAYSTSSQNETYVEIDGKQYGHILNPITGYPSANKQVGVISDSCLIGDIVSTGLFNQSSERFLSKVEEISAQSPISAYLIDESEEIHCSELFYSLCSR